MATKVWVVLCCFVFLVAASRPSVQSVDFESTLLEIDAKILSGEPIEKIQEVLVLLKNIRMKIEEEQRRDDVSNSPTQSICQEKQLTQAAVVQKQQSIVSNEIGFQNETKSSLASISTKLVVVLSQYRAAASKIAQLTDAVVASSNETASRSQTDSTKRTGRAVALQSLDLVTQRLLDAFTHLGTPTNPINPKRVQSSSLEPLSTASSPDTPVSVPQQDSQIAAAQASAQSSGAVSMLQIAADARSLVAHTSLLRSSSLSAVAQRVRALAAGHPKLSIAKSAQLKQLLQKLRASVVTSLSAVQARQKTANATTWAEQQHNFTQQLFKANQDMHQINATRSQLELRQASLQAAVNASAAKLQSSRAVLQSALAKAASIAALCTERLSSYQADSAFRKKQIKYIDGILDIVQPHIANIKAALTAGIAITGSAASDVAQLATSLTGPEAAAATNLSRALSNAHITPGVPGGVGTLASSGSPTGAADAATGGSAVEESATGATAVACPFNSKDPLSPCAASNPCSTNYGSASCKAQASAYCAKQQAGTKNDPACLTPSAQATFDKIRVNSTA